MKEKHFCRSILTLLLIAIASGLYAQAPHQVAELKKISNRFYATQSYSCDLEYLYYESYTARIPSERMSGRYIAKGDKQYQKIGQVETILNPYYVLSVDHEEKTIDVLERQAASDKSVKLGVFKPDSLISFYRKISYVDYSATIGMYELISEQDSYDKIQFYFDKKTYDLSKMVLYFYSEEEEVYEEKEEGPMWVIRPLEAPRIEILYSNIRVNDFIPDDFFTYQKYLTSSGANRYHSKPEYKNYTIN
jgi:outer membrane lipoprotein-sorting protein